MLDTVAHSFNDITLTALARSGPKRIHDPLIHRHLLILVLKASDRALAKDQAHEVLVVHRVVRIILREGHQKFHQLSWLKYAHVVKHGIDEIVATAGPRARDISFIECLLHVIPCRACLQLLAYASNHGH